MHSVIDLFHGLNIPLCAFKCARQASFCEIYSFDFKTCERGLPVKFECKQNNIDTVKKVLYAFTQ